MKRSRAYMIMGGVPVPLEQLEDLYSSKNIKREFAGMKLELKNETLRVSAKEPNFRKPKEKARSPKRGRITQYTPQSHRRFLELLNNTIHLLHVTVTLTYPSDFPTDGEIVKCHLKLFKQWLTRKGYKWVWCLEFQKRGAPHFHILIDKEIAHEEIAKRWYKIVGSQDPKHLEAGTQVQRIRDQTAMRYYFASYLGKWQQKQVPELYQNVGQFWGYSKGIDGKRVVEIYGTQEEINELLKSDVMKIIRKWNKYQRKSWKRRKGNHPYYSPSLGFKVYNQEKILSELEKRNLLPFHLRKLIGLS